MPRPYSPQIVTANRLIEGDVVYFTLTDTWSPNLADSEILHDEAHAELRLLEASSQPGQIVGAYLVDVTPAAKGPQPNHFREDFRATGPSNYHHGKQADRANV